MLKRLALLLLLLPLLGAAEPVLEGTVIQIDTTDNSGADLVEPSFAMPAGTNAVLVLTGTQSAAGELVDAVHWNTSESLTMVGETTRTAIDAADTSVRAWCLMDPTVTTANMVAERAGTTGDAVWMVTMAHSGALDDVCSTVMTELAENVDETPATDTAAFSSAGTNGNRGVIGCSLVSANPTATNSAGWTEHFEDDTGGGANGSALDLTAYVISGSLAAANTITISEIDEHACLYMSIAAAVETELEFTAGPTLDDCDATSCTFDVTPSANATVYGVAMTTGASAPADCDAVIAGTGAEDAASEAITGADTITLDSVMPEHDYYFCLDDTVGQSDVESVLNQKRDARTGYEFVDLTSVAATSVFDDDDYFNPDAATGDIVEAVSVTDPDEFAITWGADGDFEYTDATESRQSIDYCIQDVSDATGEFTVPACWTNGDDTIWVNDEPIECSDDTEVLVFTEDEAITSVDLDDDCGDESQPTYAVTDGTLPNGLSLTAATGVISGTPDTEDESGVTITFTATGEADDTDAVLKLMYVVNTVTLPDLTDGDLTDAIADMEAAFPWRVDDLGLTVTFVCHATVLDGQVISQDPAASSEVTASEEVTIDVSDDSECDFTRFRESGTYTVPAGVTAVDVLVVGGGGGGGANGNGAAGGGAGGLIFEESFAVTPEAELTVTIGAGGAGSTAGSTVPGGDGEDSVFDSLTAIGGGGGSGGILAGEEAGDGGSGGGGFASATASDPGSGTVGQGNDGGAGFTNATAGLRASGGGGGAGGVGGNASSATGGIGGSGLENDITGSTYATGGAGAARVTTTVGAAGAANTGNGGGGGGGNNGVFQVGGDGGSGIVIIKVVSTSTPGGPAKKRPKLTIGVSIGL